MSLQNLIWRRPGSMARSSGEELIRGLIHDYYRFIWRVLLRVGVSAAEVDDAAQQVFIIAARSASDVPPERIRSFLYGQDLRLAPIRRRARSG